MRLRLPFDRPSRFVGLVLPLLLALAVGTTACGGGDKGPTTPAVPQLAKLTIAQTPDTLSELNTRQLTVAGVDKDGRPMTATNLTWTSSDPTIADVDASGLVTTKQPGRVTITVASGPVSAQLALRVVPEPIADILVRISSGGLSPDTMMIGTTASLVAEPRDIGGRPLVGRTVTLSVPDTSRGLLDASGTKVTGRAVGLLTVVATSDTVVRRNTVVVRPTYAARIAVKRLDPRSLKDTMWVGLRDSVIVTYFDEAGNALPSSPFRGASFAVDNDKIAVADQQGRVVPVAPGTTTVRVTGDKLQATLTVNAVMAPITNLVAAPDTVRVMKGETTAIRPSLIDGAGQRVALLGTHSLTFASLSPSVAKVDGQGNVTALATGQGSIRVTSDRATATVPVRVLDPAGDNGFRISVRFLGPTPSPDVQAAFESARQRWQGVIRESIGTVTYRLQKGQCLSPDSTHDEVIRDVVIYARIDSIDGPGNILGSAGWCVVRRTSPTQYMPVIGNMVFDSADMNLMATTGRLVNVITHEMGHVLGIGTLWQATYHGGTAMAQQGGGDPRYFAGGAVAASAGMGFTSSSFDTKGTVLLENVPLENTGGSGTAGSHWRRSTFGNELMNGFASAGAMPLSLLTVMAMADLGYVVNTSAAETWGTYLVNSPSAASSIGVYFRSGPAEQLNEVLLTGEAVIEGPGRVRTLKAPRPGALMP